MRFICQSGHVSHYTRPEDRPKRCWCGFPAYVDMDVSTRKGYLPDPGSKWISLSVKKR